MPKVVIELTANTQEAVDQIQKFAKAQRDTFDALKAGNPGLAEASVKVSTLSKSQQEAAKASQEWQHVLNSLPGPLGDVTAEVSKLAASLGSGPAGLVVIAVTAATALTGLALSAAHNIERLDNLADATGLSVAALQSFEQAAKEAGVPPEELARSIGKINQAMAGVAQGKAGASDAFRAIGVDLQALVARGASTEEVLDAVAKALAGIEDPTRKAAAMAELFGTKSLALKTVLQQVAKDGVGGYIAAMQDAGIVTDEAANAQARALDKMADNFDRWWTKQINLTKAGAVKVATILASLPGATAAILANPEAAGKAVAAALAAPPPVAAPVAAAVAIPLTPDQVKFARDQQAQLEQIQQETLAASLKAQGLELSAIEATAASKKALLDKNLAENLALIDRISGATATGLAEQRQANETYQAAVLLLEQQTAAQRLAAISTMTTSAIKIFTDLGPRFADTVKQLTLAEFLQQTEASIKVIQGLIEAVNASEPSFEKAKLKTDRLKDGIKELTDTAATAVTKGMAPLKGAVDTIGTSFQAAARSADAAHMAFTDVGREADQAAKGGVDQLGRGIIDVGQGFAKTTGWSDDLRSHLTSDLQQETGSMNALTDAMLSGGDAASRFGSSAVKATETLAENTAALNRDFQVLTHTINGATAAADKLAGVTLTGTGPVKFSTGAAFGAAMSAPVGATSTTYAPLGTATGTTTGTMRTTSLQSGGLVGQPTVAFLAEHGPEIVLGQPSTQAFARSFAAAIAGSMPASSGSITVNLTLDGKMLAQAIIPAMRRMATRGTV